MNSQNVSGSLPEECTMNKFQVSITLHNELTAVMTFCPFLMHSLHRVHKTDTR
jgi:hypothetical protein